MKRIPFSIIILLALLCLQSTYAQNLTENALAQKYLKELEKSDYNPKIMPEPMVEDGNPVIINCEISFIDIYKVDEANMEFQAHFYLRQTWIDPRLAHSYQEIKYVVLHDTKYIWIPDLFFVQEKKGILHNLVIGIQKNGSVEFSTRLKMSFSCPMDFGRYPHDTQKCTIAVESFGHNQNKLEISLDSIEIDETISLPFEIANVITNFPTGNFSSFEIEFTFQRKVSFLITRLYIPFIFLTILSWLSFWIPTQLVAHRLSLLMVIMYLMVDVGNYINAQAPKSWYMKGSDVWISVCQSLVFATFLEFIVLNMVETYFQKKLCENDHVTGSVLESEAKIIPVSSEQSKTTVNMITNRLKKDVLLSGRIDKASSVLFPVLFLGFNFIYWLVYCTGH